MAKQKKLEETPARQYIGPEYDRGIQIPEQIVLVRPAHMTPDEVDAFVLQYPHYSEWWSAVATTETPTDESAID